MLCESAQAAVGKVCTRRCGLWRARFYLALSGIICSCVLKVSCLVYFIEVFCTNSALSCSVGKPDYFLIASKTFLLPNFCGMALLYHCSVPRPECVGETASNTHLE